MTSKVPSTEICTLCSGLSPRVYSLPPRVLQKRQRVGPACYFCFIKATGIKPTRRQQTTNGDGTSGVGTSGADGSDSRSR